jgi:uncharacterized protein
MADYAFRLRSQSYGGQVGSIRLPGWGIENAAALENSCPLTYIQDMRRDEVIAKLKDTEPALWDFGVAALYLFGSHARDEAESSSDVDVFVDPAPDRDFGFLPFMDAYETIQRGLWRRRRDRLFDPHRSVALHPQGFRTGGGTDFLMVASKSPHARLLRPAAAP